MTRVCLMDLFFPCRALELVRRNNECPQLANRSRPAKARLWHLLNPPVSHCEPEVSDVKELFRSGLRWMKEPHVAWPISALAALSSKVGGGEVSYAQARVHDDDALAGRKHLHRVEIHLAQLRNGLHKRGDALDQRQQSRAIARGRPPVAVEERLQAQSVDHLRRVEVGDRGKTERSVAEQLDENAAEAAYDQRAEGGITHHAHERLDPS